jgi:Membrane domain of glycerophosphoryl diester phosphodiesterase
MVTVLRPLSISELLDRTFHLYRNNFLIFVGIMAVPQLIVLALRLMLAVTLTASPFGGFNPMLILVGIANYLAIEISAAATVMAVSNIHLDRPVSLGSAFSSARGSMARVVLIAFAVGVAAGIGLIFLIVPGVYLWLMWSLAVPVTVLEGGGLNVCTTRSKELTRGSRGRIFVIYFLVIVLAIVVGTIFQIPLGILGVLLGRGNPQGAIALITAVSAAGTFISTSLVGPLATIALTLIYYDQRVRKEGFDLQLMMATLEPGSQSPQAASAS